MITGIYVEKARTMRRGCRRLLSLLPFLEFYSLLLLLLGEFDLVGTETKEMGIMMDGWMEMFIHSLIGRTLFVLLVIRGI